MPTYSYECAKGHVHEEFKKVSERHENRCPQCGETAKIVVTTAAHLDWNMGVDPGFPTAYERWGRIQAQKNRGKIWDSNNERYGGQYDRPKR